MRCPKCNTIVDKNQIICENCGMKLNRRPGNEPRYETVTDDGVVLLSSNTTSRRGFSRNKALAIILAVLAVLGVIAGVIVYNISNSEPEQDNRGTSDMTQTTAAQTTQPKSEAPETQATQADTSAPSGDDAGNQRRIEDYIARSSVYEDILAESDGNMTVTLFAEDNILVAQYTVPVDAGSDDQAEYVSTLDGYFDELSSRLDRVLYDLKKETAVENAEIEIRANDINGAPLYSGTIG